MLSYTYLLVTASVGIERAVSEMVEAGRCVYHFMGPLHYGVKYNTVHVIYRRGYRY